MLKKKFKIFHGILKNMFSFMILNKRTKASFEDASISDSQSVQLSLSVLVSFFKIVSDWVLPSEESCEIPQLVSN